MNSVALRPVSDRLLYSAHGALEQRSLLTITINGERTAAQLEQRIAKRDRTLRAEAIAKARTDDPEARLREAVVTMLHSDADLRAEVRRALAAIP